MHVWLISHGPVRPLRDTTHGQDVRRARANDRCSFRSAMSELHFGQGESCPGHELNELTHGTENLHHQVVASHRACGRG